MPQLTGYDKFIQQALKYGFSLWGTAKSEQKTSYRDGDDGDFEKGYPKVPPRFKDNGDGTITDNATGLMWVKNPTLDLMLWGNAIDYCLALDYAGHTDWRLSNVKELISIADYGTNTPAIDAAFFPNTVSTRYWTSTTHSLLTDEAWFVFFGDADVEHVAKNTERLVRPVRLGVPK